LQLPEIPGSLLIVGGGYIGLDLGTVYAALGSAVSVVEMTDGLLPGVDRDLVKPLASHLSTAFKNISLNSKVSNIEDTGNGITCQIQDQQGAVRNEKFDYVLVAVGRKPNTEGLALENAMIEADKHGFIPINNLCQTNNKKIMAIGDVSGQPMLAHRAMRQGYVAAEVIAGLPSAFDNQVIPAVVYTEPEIAWCGVTDIEIKANGLKLDVAKFPWSASGRAMTLANTNGLTKIIYDPQTNLIKGVGIVGPRAGDLIAEAVLAIETGLVLQDLAHTIHPHPSLSETIAESAMSALHRQARRAASPA
jgi:dihydrolipoamide dehydrogenase